MISTFPKLASTTLLLLILPACSPNFQASANRLRAQTITQDRTIADLNQKLANRDASILSLQKQLDEKSPRIQTLPEERLASLFTVARLEIQKSSSLSDLGDNKHGLRVALRTLTDDGTIFPSTGTLTIDAVAVNAAPTPPARVGTWTFSPADMKSHWYAGLGLNHFAFDCPFTSENPTAPIVLTANFTDTLTGKSLTATLTLQPPKK